MSELFQELKKGLEEAIAIEKGQEKGKITVLEIRPVCNYDKTEIRAIRMKAGFTQSMMASYMGVSKKTVEAWESGKNKPSGTACRLLQILEAGNLARVPFVTISA